MTIDYTLQSGSHEKREIGMCAMEWVAFLANEPHSDAPDCVSPVLTQFCVVFNDRLPDDRRQRLRPYLTRTIGTRDDGHDEERAWMCLDWLIRVYAPTWLSLAHLEDAAERLRSLPPVLAAENLTRAMDDVSYARDRADAAGAAAWDGDAAGAIFRAAARAAAWDAARAAAAAAAWDGDAAGAIFRAGAWHAARAAARAAAAAWDGDALQPTADLLQDWAFDLLDRMVGFNDEVIQLPEPMAREYERLLAA
jgi:hypothetical protein